MEGDSWPSPLPVKRSKRSVSRNQMLKQPDGKECPKEEQHPVSCEAVGKSLRIWEPWSGESTALFYEALKQFGKDFESIRRYIARKSRPENQKSCDQVRNFYQNTYKKVSTQLNLGEIFASEEAKQLFVLINLGEWQKKVQVGQKKAQDLKPKSIPKLKELIMTGSVTVKVGKKGGKAQQKFIRTPVCMALRKLCEDTKDPLKELPGRVKLELLPKTYGDKAYILDTEQNPYLRIEAPPSRPLRQYLRFLRRKWISAHDKQRVRLLGRDVCDFLPWITLYPSKYTTLTATKIRAQTTSMPVCLEKCQQYTQRRKAGTGGTQPPHPCPKEEKEVEEMRSPLDPLRMRQGLTEENVHNITVGELCLVCNSSPVIQLCYSIEKRSDGTDGSSRSPNPAQHKEAESPEPWKCLMRLLAREYGENLQRALAAKDNAKYRSSVGFAVPSSTITPGRTKKRAPKMSAKSGESGAVQPDKVATENRAFELQCGELFGKGRSLFPNISRRQIVDTGESAAAPSTTTTVAPTFELRAGIQYTYPNGEEALMNHSGFMEFPEEDFLMEELPPTDPSQEDDPPVEEARAQPPERTERRQLDFSHMAGPTSTAHSSSQRSASLLPDDFILTSPEKRLVASGGHSEEYLGSCAQGIDAIMNMDTNDFSHQIGLESNGGTLNTPKKLV